MISKSIRISILCLIMAVVSCSNITKDTIVGAWKIVDFEMIADISPSIIQKAREMALITTYTFKEDGSYRVINEDEATEFEGNWSLTEDLETLSLKPKNMAGSQEFNIIEFKKDKIVFELYYGELNIETYTLEKK